MPRLQGQHSMAGEGLVCGALTTVDSPSENPSNLALAAESGYLCAYCLLTSPFPVIPRASPMNYVSKTLTHRASFQIFRLKQPQAHFYAAFRETAVTLTHKCREEWVCGDRHILP